MQLASSRASCRRELRAPFSEPCVSARLPRPCRSKRPASRTPVSALCLSASPRLRRLTGFSRGGQASCRPLQRERGVAPCWNRSDRSYAVKLRLFVASSVEEGLFDHGTHRSAIDQTAATARGDLPLAAACEPRFKIGQKTRIGSGTLPTNPVAAFPPCDQSCTQAPPPPAGSGSAVDATPRALAATKGVTARNGGKR